MRCVVQQSTYHLVSDDAILTCFQHYNHLASQETEAARAEYKRWVESHSPEQIKQANRARNQLNKKFPPKPADGKHQRHAKFSQIQDERQPKQPMGSYILFAKNRQESGDFKNIAIPERAKLIGQEWRALTLAEKQVCGHTNQLEMWQED